MKSKDKQGGCVASSIESPVSQNYKNLTSSEALPHCKWVHILQKNCKALIPLANPQKLYTLSYNNLKRMTLEQMLDDANNGESWEEEKRSGSTDLDSADDG